MIAELSRTLHITDGVIRFRINKLKPGTPDAPEMRPERAGGAPAREEAPPRARDEAEHVPAEEHPDGHAQGEHDRQAVA